MNTVADLQLVNGLWIQDSQEVEAINRELGVEFPSYFMVDPEDGGRSGQFKVYGCWSWLPLLTSTVEGPFNYPQ